MDRNKSRMQKNSGTGLQLAFFCLGWVGLGKAFLYDGSLGIMSATIGAQEEFTSRVKLCTAGRIKVNGDYQRQRAS